MKLLTLAIFLVALGCTKNTPVLQPLQVAACDVETAVTSAFGSAIVADCGGTNAVACGGAFQAALGNVNMCAQPVPTPPVSADSKIAAPKMTIGDVTSQQIAAAKGGRTIKSDAAKPMGIVGSIACPIAINTVLGFLTGAIPQACGCTKSLSASATATDLTAACVAAVPL